MIEFDLTAMAVETANNTAQIDSECSDNEIIKSVDEMKIAYDKNGMPYMLEATGSEAVHINELLQAEHENRLCILPCVVGDTVYIIDENPEPYVTEAVVTVVGYDIEGFWVTLSLPVGYKINASISEKSFGETLFRTKREAEIKLEKKKNERNSKICKQ